jgi:hypothetical protein
LPAFLLFYQDVYGQDKVFAAVDVVEEGMQMIQMRLIQMMTLGAVAVNQALLWRIVEWVVTSMLAAMTNDADLVHEWTMRDCHCGTDKGAVVEAKKLGSHMCRWQVQIGCHVFHHVQGMLCLVRQK